MIKKEKITCHCCPYIGIRDDFILQDDNYYCQSCHEDIFTYCESCDELVERENLLIAYHSGEMRVCEDCRYNHFYYCQGCGEYVHQDSMGNCDYCDECYNEEENDDWIADFYGQATSQRLGKYLPQKVGVEIELYCTDRHSLTDDINFLTHKIGGNFKIGFKPDGSLHNQNGIEIVTPPMQGIMINKIMGAIDKGINSNECSVNTDCGLHVHIDSSKLDDFKLYNFVRMIYLTEHIIYLMLPKSRNKNTYTSPLKNRFNYNNFRKTKYKEFDRVFYGLNKKDIKSYEYSYKFIEPDYKREYNINSLDDYIKQEKAREEKHIKSIKRTHGGQGRYLGANIQSHYHRKTIEFRYHSGTINKKKIINWIRFCQHLVNRAEVGYNTAKLYDVICTKEPADEIQKFFDFLELPEDLKNYLKNRIKKFNKNLLDKRYKINKPKKMKLSRLEEKRIISPYNVTFSDVTGSQISIN